ncbi:MAG: response regulator transcription factor [Candidatus Riflebacteria bacterium]|nr:response regulator transcription factor [Candidatus Riflebacteria bacterium]
MGKKFVILDDHPAIRYALRSYVEDAGHHVMMEGASLADGRSFFAQGEFDVLIIDLAFGDGCGCDLIKECRKKNPDSKIIVFSMGILASTIQRALDAGADGFFCKVDNLEFLPSAFEEVLAGGTYISSRARQSLEKDKHNELPHITVTPCKLSPKEGLILGLLGEGLTRKEISLRTEISIQTTETHLRRAAIKLGLTSRRDLVRYAISLKKDHCS